MKEGAMLGLLPTTCFKKQLAVNPNATPAYLVIPMPIADAPPTTVICQPGWAS